MQCSMRDFILAEHAPSSRGIPEGFSLASHCSSPLRRQGPSAFAHELAHVVHAPSERGIHAFFHSPQASESLSLAWPRESNHCAAGAARTAQLARRAQGRSPESREGHPTFAPCAQSLCFRCASLLRGSLTVHPWTGIELAHIVWATLRADPPQPRRDRGDPVERASCAPKPKPLLRPPGTFSREAGEGNASAKRWCAAICFALAAQDAQ